MVSIGSDGGLVGPNPEGGPVVDRVVFWSVGVGANRRFDRFRFGFDVLVQKVADLKNPPLGSGNTQNLVL